MEFNPAILSAAILPCLFAGPASGIAVFVLFMKSTTSIASPTANTPFALVSILSFTKICPLAPSLIPAAFANPVSGMTPIASITISVHIFLPLFKITSIAASLSLKAFTPSLRTISTPLSEISFSTVTTTSVSKGANK